jgi:iron-sulfur cluster assembly protein
MKEIGLGTNKNSFLFSVSSGGCAGLNFDFRNVDFSEIREISKDSKIKMAKINNDGINVYVDPLSEMYLIGTTIDYVNENFSKGIFESKFLFQPDKNFAGGCGCGTSFYLKDDNQN